MSELQLIGRCERHLNVPLNEYEKVEEGNKLISQLNDFDLHEAQSKLSAQTYKKQLDDQWAEIAHTRNVIEKGPVKLVRCVEYLDAQNEKVVTVRTDTGAEVSTRPAEAEDYQVKLEIFDGKQSKAV